MITLLSNLGLTALFAFALGQTYRVWPPTHAPTDRLLRAALALGAAVVLAWHGHASGQEYGLSLVAVALVTLRYGPLYALPCLLVALIPGLHPAQVLLQSAGVILMSSVLRPAVRIDLSPGPRLLWTLPLIFLTGHLSGALGGPALPPLALLTTMGLQVSAMALIIWALHSRLRLLSASYTFREQAYTDALTGLSNRRQFSDDLGRIEHGDHLLILDLDHFKRVNDQHGHAEGDATLKRVAAALRASLRPQDTAYRIGGEEFAALLPRTSPDDARQIADRCREMARQRPPAPPVTLSGGLARHGLRDDPAATHRRADEALYAAKEAGRDRVLTAPPALPSTLPAPRGPWQALRSVLEQAPDRDFGPAEWNALLRAACDGVPDVQGGSLYVVEAGDFIMRAQIGFDDALLGDRCPPGAQRAWYALNDAAWISGQPRVLRGYAIETAAQHAAELALNSGAQVRGDQWRLTDICETLGVPITDDGHVIAFLNLDRFTPGAAFDASAQELAVTFAAQASLLLAGRARRAREARRTHELEALVQITGALRDARDMPAVLSAMNSMSHVLLDALQSVYMQYDPDSDALVSSGLYGFDETVSHLRLPRGQGLSWTAVNAREVIRVNDLNRDPRSVGTHSVRGAAGLLAPLFSRERLLGVLVVIRHEPFGEDDAQLARAITAQSVTAIERAERIQAVESGRDGILLALGRALEVRDFETRGHTERVLRLAQAVGQDLGLTGEDLAALRDGAYLHDLGKVQIPDAVLLKPGPLDHQEWELMRTHAGAGEDLARHIPGLSPRALEVIRHHHERWDGSGYPDGLQAEEIPLLARIFSVCDVFDALISPRPYKAAWSVPDALTELRRLAGQGLDPHVVEVFLTHMDAHPALPDAPAPDRPRPAARPGER
ncbi:HD domain-containing phosphohydrolase [Deinococcus depolymerans]|uniref:Diguanylate cyclase n=1 Tax=Deinococcus depolymerans TaxID=392408 RepID=A0ABN1BP23_9DEIO